MLFQYFAPREVSRGISTIHRRLTRDSLLYRTPQKSQQFDCKVNQREKKITALNPSAARSTADRAIAPTTAIHPSTVAQFYGSDIAATFFLSATGSATPATPMRLRCHRQPPLSVAGCTRLATSRESLVYLSGKDASIIGGTAKREVGVVLEAPGLRSIAHLPGR